MSITLRRPIGRRPNSSRPSPAEAARRVEGQAAKDAAAGAADRPQGAGDASPSAASLASICFRPRCAMTRKARRTRRAFGWGVLATVLVVVLAGGAAAFALQRRGAGAAARGPGADRQLLAQQQKFIDVRNVQNQVALVQAAQQVGASTEIDWQALPRPGAGDAARNVTIQQRDDGLRDAARDCTSSRPIRCRGRASRPSRSPRRVRPSRRCPPGCAPSRSSPASRMRRRAPSASTRRRASTPSNITMHVNDAAFDKRFQPKGK